MTQPYYPEQPFAEFAEDRRVSKTADPTSAHVPEVIKRWVDYGRRDLDRSGAEIVSLACEHGLRTVEYRWGLPIEDLGGALQTAARLEAEGHGPLGGYFNPMPTDHVHESPIKVTFRLDYPTQEKLADLTEFLGIPYQSETVRHLLATSFRDYNGLVRENQLMREWSRPLERYIDVLEDSIDSRRKICEKELEMDLDEPTIGRWDQ